MSGLPAQTGRHRHSWTVPVAALLAATPIVVATARAVASGWLAIGDNANFLIRSRDVLTEHHPLLGTWTSASLSIGTNIDNPGPLYFDLLALPAKVGGHAGLAIGVAALNIACIALIAWFATRNAGVAGGATAMVMTTGLAWTMGSELLFDPWQPHGLLFAVLLFLVLVWAMLSGDLVALPVAAVVASLIVQTHLSYALIVPVLGTVGVAGLIARRRRDRSMQAGSRRLVILSALLVVVCWAQPLAEQVLGDGPGNLGRILRSAGTSDATVGVPLAVRLTGDVLGTPPYWARPSFADAFRGVEHGPVVSGGRPNVVGLPSTATAVLGIGLLVLAAVLIGITRRGTPSGRAGGLVPVIVALAVGTTAILPVTGFGVAQHQLRFLWPAGVFATWVLLLLGAELLAKSTVPMVVILPLVAILSAAAIPAWNPMVGPPADAEAIPVVGDLRNDLHAVDLSGLGEPVLFDLRDQRFAEPYTAPVMATLQELGVDFRVSDEGMVAQLGPGRRATGRETLRIVVREGDDARPDEGSGRQLAFATALSPTERTEMDSLRRASSLTPTAQRRLADLERRWARLTAAVFVTPVMS